MANDIENTADKAAAAAKAQVAEMRAELGKADLGDYLSFRAMITPVAIQIVFWLLVAGSVLSSLGLIFSGAVVQGLVALILGPLMIRIFCELVIVTFKMNEGIQRIAKQGGLR